MQQTDTTVSVSDAPPDVLAQDKKIVLVIDPALGRGATDNRAAVLATGLAAKHPEIVGEGLMTSDGEELLPFTKVPIVVLVAKAETVLRELAAKAKAAGCTTLVFLSRAQGMRSYDAYRFSVSESDSHELDVDAVLLYGPKRIVNRFAGSLPALR